VTSGKKLSHFASQLSNSLTFPDFPDYKGTFQTFPQYAQRSSQVVVVVVAATRNLEKEIEM